MTSMLSQISKTKTHPISLTASNPKMFEKLDKKIDRIDKGE